MSSPAEVYDARPWVQHYGTIPAELPEPQFSNLPALIEDSVAKYREQKAFTAVTANGMNGSLTFGRVDELSDAFAVYLRDVLGVAPGTRVAVQMPNSLTYPIVTFGVLKAGCVLVNVNPLYTADEMEKQFVDADVEVLVIINMFTDKLTEILPRTPIKHVVVSRISQFFPPVIRNVINLVHQYWNQVIPKCEIEATPFEKALEAGQRAQREKGIEVRRYWQELNRNDLAVLQYTGGTTGVAKGAMLTHGNLLFNIEQTEARSIDYMDEGKETMLTALPLYHVFAFTVNLMSFFKAGAHNILIPSPRPIQNLQRAIENYPISWMTGVNTLYNALMQEEWFWRHPPKHLKGAIAGGAALQSAVAKRWEEMTGTRLVEGYGLTETSPVVTFSPMDGQARLGSIGIPVPGTTIRIVDEQGNPVPQGESGELIVKGPQVMQGYWRKDTETAKTIKDGWLYTGDMARMDEDGFLYIVDRKKDMVLVSGFNVYPNEVEDCIAKIDAVQEVAVIGVPDEATGEAVRAYIVKRADLTKQEVIKHCKEHLAAYKVPKQIEFRDDLPKTPIGKVLRKDLRSEYMAAHGAQ